MYNANQKDVNYHHLLVDSGIFSLTSCLFISATISQLYFIGCLTTI